MTQEEKAKAYDKALEKIHQFIDGYSRREISKEELEDIFPELAESEDEKIRKALIRFHKSTIDVDGIKGDDIIAWLENIPYTIDREKREGFHLGYKAGLEKQGDSPVKWNKNNEGNKPQVNHSILMKTTQGIAEGEWKGEYWEQYRWAGIVRDSDVLSWMELSSLEKQGEQKPTLRERYKNIAESEWFKKTHDGMSVSNDEGMIEALRTEYEKGRADVIADTLSWLENCWPRYCSNQTIIEGFKEAIKE